MEKYYIVDKSWMYKYKTKHERVNAEFLAGLCCFMEFALTNKNNDASRQMLCPCAKCENKLYYDNDTIEFHIIKEGFTQRYNMWYFHGEPRKRHRKEDNTKTSNPPSGLSMKKNRSAQRQNKYADAISTAIEVLESSFANPTRESERQIHLSNEVLEAHYLGIEESDSLNLNAPTSSRRKPRGPTHRTAVIPAKGEKWKCLMIEGQPVGKAASKLATILGLYARMGDYFCPHKEWKDQSKQSFNDVMRDIMGDYEFVDHEEKPIDAVVITRFCKSSIQKKIREWRWWLKSRYFIEGVPKEELIACPDPRVNQTEWEALLDYWGNDKKVLEAERNKKNRGEEQTTHTLGAKSIARHCHDERENMGSDYTTLGSYLKAHQTKNGEYANEYTRVMCEKVISSCVERNITNSSEPFILSPVLDNVYNGHHGGYERGRGLGWSRRSRDSVPIFNSDDTVGQLIDELQSVKEQIEVLQARDRERQAQIDRMEAILSTLCDNPVEAVRLDSATLDSESTR